MAKINVKKKFKKMLQKLSEKKLSEKKLSEKKLSEKFIIRIIAFYDL